MAFDMKKKWCARCNRPSGLRIVFGDTTYMSEDILEAAEAGEIVLGGENTTTLGTPYTINTVCPVCNTFWNSEWHDSA